MGCNARKTNKKQQTNNNCSPNTIYSGEKMEKSEIDGRCGIYEGEQK